MRTNIKDIPTEEIAELLEDHTVKEAAEILNCSRSGLRYQMTKRGIESRYLGSPKHTARLSKAAIARFGYTDNDALIEMLKRLGRKLGHRPTLKDLREAEGYPSKHIFADRFGSWVTALKLAGFNPKRHASRYDIPNSTLLNGLQELAKELGHRPRRRDLKGREGYPSISVYEHRFGSWTGTLQKAGFEMKRVKRKKPKPRTVPIEERIYKRITSRLRFAVLKRDGFRCRYCGRTPEDGITLTLDHVIPESKGGLTTYKNLIVSCLECNMGKNDTQNITPPQIYAPARA